MMRNDGMAQLAAAGLGNDHNEDQARRGCCEMTPASGLGS